MRRGVQPVATSCSTIPAWLGASRRWAPDALTAMRRHFDVGYRELLVDLGITSFADLRRRAEQVRALLPRLWAVAEAIIAANPDVED